MAPETGGGGNSCPWPHLGISSGPASETQGDLEDLNPAFSYQMISGSCSGLEDSCQIL